QLENFSRDPKEALRLLKASGAAPNFPDEQWKDLLEGLPLDFDALDKGLFDGKGITTEADWNRVWRKVEDAMGFAFSQRRSELAVYGTYILDFFQQFRPELHVNVINFDRAVRKFIASSKDVLFSDTNRFVHLEKSYLTPGGKHYSELAPPCGPKRQSCGY
ncbi:hypothetical protein MPER_02329, partial [Moniliophthora perniciosa FA553]